MIVYRLWNKERAIYYTSTHNKLGIYTTLQDAAKLQCQMIDKSKYKIVKWKLEEVIE